MRIHKVVDGVEVLAEDGIPVGKTVELRRGLIEVGPVPGAGPPGVGADDQHGAARQVQDLPAPLEGGDLLVGVLGQAVPARLVG